MMVPAVVVWAAHLGWLDLQGTRLAFMGNSFTWIVFTLLGLGEFIADKLPNTPNRTSPVGLLARLIMGAFVGASLALAAGHLAYVGALLGGAGAMVGAFVGFQFRTRSVKALKIPDFIIALLEDLIAVGGALLIVSRHL